MIELNNKVAVVTGSGRGIGKAIALKLAQAGAKVVISDINEETVNETVNEFKAQGLEAIGVPANVTVAEDCTKLMDEAVKNFGALDILVNNAGITKDGLIIRMDESDWDAVIAVNLKGVYLCSKAAIKIMMKKKTGNIINLASVVGITGNAGQANYSATKGAVISLTKTLAKEYASRKIRVNAIAPGFIQSEMTDKIPEKERNAMISTIPLKRLGQPEDIADAALFLASDLASYVTSQVIVVDGGMIG